MLLDWCACSRESTQDPRHQEQWFPMISWKWVAKGLGWINNADVWNCITGLYHLFFFFCACFRLSSSPSSSYSGSSTINTSVSKASKSSSAFPCEASKQINHDLFIQKTTIINDNVCLAPMYKFSSNHERFNMMIAT